MWSTPSRNGSRCRALLFRSGDVFGQLRDRRPGLFDPSGDHERRSRFLLAKAMHRERPSLCREPIARRGALIEPSVAVGLPLSFALQFLTVPLLSFGVRLVFLVRLPFVQGRQIVIIDRGVPSESTSMSAARVRADSLCSERVLPSP